VVSVFFDYINSIYCFILLHILIFIFIHFIFIHFYTFKYIVQSFIPSDSLFNIELFISKKIKAIRPTANRTSANALSRVAPLVSLGLAELEVVAPMVDGSEAAVGETEAEEADDAVGVEAVGARGRSHHPRPFSVSLVSYV
jgi:hypothetical protein